MIISEFPILTSLCAGDDMDGRFFLCFRQIRCLTFLFAHYCFYHLHIIDCSTIKHIFTLDLSFHLLPGNLTTSNGARRTYLISTLRIANRNKYSHIMHVTFLIQQLILLADEHDLSTQKYYHLDRLNDASNRVVLIGDAAHCTLVQNFHIEPIYKRT